MKQTHKLTIDQKNEAVNLFLQGENFNQIAKKFSVTPPAIRFLLNKRGHLAKYNGKLPPEKQIEICEKFKTGNYYFTELAIEHNVSPEAMRSMLNKHGLFSPSANEIHRKHNLNESFFQEIETPQKAYILGLFYADGCNAIENNKVVITLQNGDQKILETIRDIIQPTKPIYFRGPHKLKGKNGTEFNSKGHYTLAIISQKICKDLERHGMTPRKSMKLAWPHWLKEDLIPHFVRGFFDGDGGVSANGGISFTANKEFLDDLLVVLNSRGLCPLNKIHKNCISDVFSFCFSAKKDISSFYSWLYNENGGMFLDRKKDKMEKFIL